MNIFFEEYYRGHVKAGNFKRNFSDCTSCLRFPSASRYRAAFGAENNAILLLSRLQLHKFDSATAQTHLQLRIPCLERHTVPTLHVYTSSERRTLLAVRKPRYYDWYGYRLASSERTFRLHGNGLRRYCLRCRRHAAASLTLKRRVGIVRVVTTV